MNDINILQDASQSRIIAAIEENLFQSWIAMGKTPSIDLYVGEDKIQFISGVNFPLCNGVFRARLDSSVIDSQIKSILTPFKKLNLPVFWWTGPATYPENLHLQLEKHGLKYVDAWPGMAMELSDIKIKKIPAGLIIKQVSSIEILQRWSRPFATVFEMPDFVMDFFINIFVSSGFSPASSFRNYIGLWDNSPVACATVFYGAGVAGIYNIATLKEFRGKGIGTAITSYPLLEAMKLGYRYGILHSSDMGYQLYSKIGFKGFCKVSAYTWQPGETTDSH